MICAASDGRLILGSFGGKNIKRIGGYAGALDHRSDRAGGGVLVR